MKIRWPSSLCPCVRPRTLVIGMLLACAAMPAAEATGLLAGAATVSITPDRPVALSGQMKTRISGGVSSPVTATVLMLESREDGGANGTTTFVATNQFGLHTDFGVALKARSPAVQTFVVQLAGRGSYLPSGRAVRGGGYSAITESNEVGPEAGQVLVDHTVARIAELFPGSRRSP